MKKILFYRNSISLMTVICSVLLFGNIAYSQPKSSYQELPNPKTTRFDLWNKQTKDVVISWGSVDDRYAKEVPFDKEKLSNTIHLTAWRGERISAQIVISAKREVKDIFVTDRYIDKEKGKKLPVKFRKGFVRYVLTDGLGPQKESYCGARNKADFDSALVADPIDITIKKMTVKANTTQCVWLTLDIPQKMKAGDYFTNIVVSNGMGVKQVLDFKLTVTERVLPTPSEWSYHLDLWQNPYAVSRFYGVKPFSKEHFKLMTPIMRHYANAGGKAITASIIYKPWNGQTFDAYDTMVGWTKKKDGTWSFDYTLFDKWVEYMMKLGVDKQINCYSMIPWRLSFRYFDEASNSYKHLSAKPGDTEYNNFWLPMLRSFATHLRSKGWFEITHIAMDERPMKDMLSVIELIKRADKDFKIAYAGNYHAELMGDMNDYSIAMNQTFPANELKVRKNKGFKSTYYTCCVEGRPNTFTFSSPVEAEWISWRAAREGLDGYLRWALNSWVEKPLHDSRFITWPAGDTYMIYPYGMSSIRFERFRDGIQAFEKIRILRKESKNNDKINKILSTFDDLKVVFEDQRDIVNKAKRAINNM